MAIIFASIQLINQQEDAISRIISKVIGPKIIEKIGKAEIGKQRKDLLLEKMLDELLKVLKILKIFIINFSYAIDGKSTQKNRINSLRKLLHFWIFAFSILSFPFWMRLILNNLFLI